MSVELIIALPAAGKTKFCIQKIRDFQRSQPLAKVWVVVPDRYQAAAFRQRLAGAGGALGAQVGRFEDLYRHILERAQVYMPVTSFSLAHRIIQATVDEAVLAGVLPHFAPLQYFPGFILALQESFAELKRAVVSPEDFSAFVSQGSPAHHDLASLYDRYQKLLLKLGWADAEDIHLLAISALELEASTSADIQLLIVDGFDSFNEAQYRVLNLLAESIGEMVISLPGLLYSRRQVHHRFNESAQRLIDELAPLITELKDPPCLPEELRHIEQHLFEAEQGDFQSCSTPILLEARSPADEVREALRWIKHLVIRQKVSISDCAIFTPNPGVYHRLLREIADEYGIPFRFTLDETLDKLPAIVALLNFLSLPVDNFSSRKLFNVLRSPYFSFPFDIEVVDTLERVSRVAQIIEGLAQWEEAWERLIVPGYAGQFDLEEERNAPNLPRGKDAEGLRHLITAVFKMLTPPEKDNTQTEWISWVEDLLDTLCFQENVDPERDRSAFEVFREVLRSLVISEAVAGRRKVSYEQFLSDLQGTLRGQRYRETTYIGQPALLVGRMSEARGIRYQAVALLGLSEGSFPINEHPDPLLDDTLRSALGLESRLQRDQAGLFYQAITRSDRHLLITRPFLSGDGEPWEPSSYWQGVKELLDDTAVIRVKPDQQRPLAEAASVQELLFSAVRRRSLPQKYAFLLDRWHDLQHAKVVLQARRAREVNGSYEGFSCSISSALNQRHSSSAIWSSSRLENYGNCPFRFYVTNELELDARVESGLGMDAAQLGLMLHEILEAAYKSAESKQAVQCVLESLRIEAERIFSAAPRKYGFRPSPYWAIEQIQMLEKLDKTIRALAEDRSWTPYAFEAKFGIGGTPILEIKLGDERIKLRGVIDRVDRDHHGNLRVIDYKTGGSHMSASDLKKGYRLQLPIYVMAARDALALGTPTDGLYWKILSAEASSLKLAKFFTENSQGVDAAIEVVREHLMRIVSGIRAAEFPPQAPEGGCPSYCPAASWCWRYVPGW